MKRFSLLLCAAALWAVAGVAAPLPAGTHAAAVAAQPASQLPPGPVSWDALTPNEKQLLNYQKDKWSSLPVQRQHKLVNAADRYSKSSPAERAQFQERLQGWQKLSPAQRTRVRQRYEAFQKLPPDEQQHIRDMYKKYQKLPADKKQQLHKRWDGVPPEQKDAIKNKLAAPATATTPATRSAPQKPPTP